jgi:hypothetical protein
MITQWQERAVLSGFPNHLLIILTRPLQKQSHWQWDNKLAVDYNNHLGALSQLQQQ